MNVFKWFYFREVPNTFRFWGTLREKFWAHFAQVLGRLAGAWCDSGQADDSVDSLMHGHTM